MIAVESFGPPLMAKLFFYLISLTDLGATAAKRITVVREGKSLHKTGKLFTNLSNPSSFPSSCSSAISLTRKQHLPVPTGRTEVMAYGMEQRHGYKASWSDSVLLNVFGWHDNFRPQFQHISPACRSEVSRSGRRAPKGIVDQSTERVRSY